MTSIISDPNADPHQYESDAHDAAAVADAGLVIDNGLGYDDFIDKLLVATSNTGRAVLTVADVSHVTATTRTRTSGTTLPRVPTVAAAIDGALVAADPARRGEFAANLRTFDASLAPLTARRRPDRRKYPHAPVAYTERVPGYLLAAAGLTIATPPGFAQAIEDGNEPSAGDAQAMDDLDH